MIIVFCLPQRQLFLVVQHVDKIPLCHRIVDVELLQELLDVLPLGKPVIGAGTFYIGDRIVLQRLLNIAFVTVDQWTDESRIRTAHVHLRQKRGNLSAMDHVEEQGLHRIIAVMAEGDLRASQLLCGSDDRRFFEFGAQRALQRAVLGKISL